MFRPDFFKVFSIFFWEFTEHCLDLTDICKIYPTWSGFPQHFSSSIFQTLKNTTHYQATFFKSSKIHTRQQFSNLQTYNRLASNVSQIFRNTTYSSCIAQDPDPGDFPQTGPCSIKWSELDLNSKPLQHPTSSCVGWNRFLPCCAAWKGVFNWASRLATLV